MSTSLHHTQTSPNRTARRGAAAVIATTLVALGLAAGATPALAHDVLTGQSVVTDSNDVATGITLSFNNDVIEVGSEINVADESGAVVSEGTPTVAGRDVTQNVAAPLDEGDYTVTWRVVSSDGHPIEGVMSLSIDAAGAGTLSAEAAADEHEHADDESADHEHTDGESADHDHADDAATPISDSADEGRDPLVTTLIIVLIALAAAGAVTAVLVGTRRRRAAFDEAVREANQNTPNEQ